LRNINFEVQKGEVLGIIGKNGAGKSTLLKILSRVTSPTVGSVKTKGRIASLLEVGTGFHPEMTGRENIYLNGAILGMTKKEIATKIDEIIEFSGCERYIDTPVKRYSSGMTVRLAFAVAAHLEPEILVVDEVLAVGDAEFQKKAIGKMQDISKTDGRTVLFVSHNMAAVQSLCTRGIVIKNGTVFFQGEIEESIQEYLKDSSQSITLSDFKNRKGNGIVTVESINVYGKSKDYLPQTGQPFNLEISLKNQNKIVNSSIDIDVRIDDNMGQRIAWFSNSILPNQELLSPNSIIFSIDKLNLNNGLYYITTQIRVDKVISDWIQNGYSFEITEGDFYGTGKKIPQTQSKLLIDFKIKYS
jgi:lipopolysaccharide transport system ATP-binding protein